MVNEGQQQWVCERTPQTAEVGTQGDQKIGWRVRHPIIFNLHPFLVFSTRLRV